jgi:hypothetical protein
MSAPPPGSAETAADARAAGTREALLSHLPPAPARLLLVPAPPGLAGQLRRAGYEVPEEASGTPFDAAVLLPEAGADPAARLAAMRPRLAAAGRLLAVGGPPPEDVRLLRRRLYEAAFAVLAEEPIGEAGGTLAVARPARHRVRPYREGDETAILDLFARAFHHRRNVERWRWAYAENPYGDRRISLALDDEDRLAAHYAGYPVRMWSEDGWAGGGRDGPGAVECLHVGDTMTAPEARRVGRGATNLLTRTVRHFYATWCEGRVAFNYGANTGKIQRFSRRTAGARRLEAAPFRTRALDRPWAAPGGWAARLAGWRVERIAVRGGFDERFDDLWRRCRGAYRLLVERDRRYLAWRYAAPDVEYSVWTVSRRGRLAGWAVFRLEGERLVWGDAMFDPRQPRAAAVLLARAAAAPEHRGARRIEGWLTDRPAWWGQVVSRLGFVAEPEPEDLGLVYVPFEVDPGEAFAKHLYYTKADTDLF